MANGLNKEYGGNERVKKVAIYIRVSTTYQIDKDSLPMQRKDLTAYSELMLGISDYEIFEDAGYSGKNTDRPAFQEMMARIRKHEFSHLLVWKIDRISRNLLDFSQMYSELQKLRVTFVSKNEQFDTSTAMGEAMLKIILVFAELERNMTSERVTATMISRANQGLWNGGRVPYGYDYDPENDKFSIREDEAAVCRLIKDDYLAYKSTIHTVQTVNNKGLKTRDGNEWSTSTVWHIMTNPFYIGSYRYNRFKGTEHKQEKPQDEWVVIPNHHPAIFTEDEQEKMLFFLSENAAGRNAPGGQHRRKYVHVFRDVVFCGKCGARMTASPSKNKQGRVYSNHACSNRRNTNKCDNPFVSEYKVGEFVINYVLNMMQAKAHFSEISDIPALEKRLLSGGTFKGIKRIEPDGLKAFFDLLSRYKSDVSYILVSPVAQAQNSSPDPEKTALQKEREKQRRALKRLQDLYLYSDKSISEKDYIIRRDEITSQLDRIEEKLGEKTQDAFDGLSDEDFVRQASHLLISSRLQNKEYIYYKDFAESVSRDVLQEYVKGIISKVMVSDGLVVSITFKNGLTHVFER